jgi:hypothetical protein
MRVAIGLQCMKYGGSIATAWQRLAWSTRPAALRTPGPHSLKLAPEVTVAGIAIGRAEFHLRDGRER